MRQDLMRRETTINKELDILSTKVNNQIVLTRTDALNEISNIKNIASSLAEQEARKKINEILDYRNINSYIDEVAEQRIKPRVNELVDSQINENQKKQIEEALNNLDSQNYLQLSKSITDLTINNNIKLNESQLKRVIGIIESDGVLIQYLDSYHVILIKNPCQIVTEYYKNKLNLYQNETQKEVTNIRYAYNYFFLNELEFDYMLSHLLDRISNSTSPGDPLELVIQINGNASKRYILKFLNNPKLIDLIYSRYNDSSEFKNFQSRLRPTLSITISSNEINNTYAFKRS
jgi:hypothetical protein